MKILTVPFSILRNSKLFFEEIINNNNVKEKIYTQFLIMTAFFFIYGFIIGISNGILQGLSSALKLPILFIITLMICFPTLYIFNILFGSKLSISQHLALFLSMQSVTSLFLIAFSPITIFFLITGQNYQFYKLLNVGIFIISGFIGVRILFKGIGISNINNDNELVKMKNTEKPDSNKFFITLWIILYSFVGTQLAWILRPFFGYPDLPFQLFRNLSGNFYLNVIQSFAEILGF